MTKPLTVEQRRKVAEACEPEYAWVTGILECPSYTIDRPNGIAIGAWQPEEELDQWQTLVQKAAQLIEGKKSQGLQMTRDGIVYYVLMERLNAAIARNDVTAIELLVLELLEGRE